MYNSGRVFVIVCAEPLHVISTTSEITIYSALEIMDVFEKNICSLSCLG